MEIYNFNINNNPYEVKIVSIKGTVAVVEVNGIEYNIDISDIEDLDIPATAPAQKTAPQIPVTSERDAPVTALQQKPDKTQNAAAANSITSPMPGQILKILVAAGDTVKAGDTVVTIEAMKMENQIRSTMDGKVSKIHVKEGDIVAEGAPLISLGG